MSERESKRRSTEPNPMLSRLDALAGEWDMETSVDERPLGRGRAVFEWFEGGAFLVQHADAAALSGAPAEWVANSPFPLVTIIGLEDSNEQFSMLYADGRGVFRVYRMSLADGVWELWRDAPGFSQRFTGTLNDDGSSITAHWESSSDGSNWEHDFDVTYTKVR